MTPEEVMLYGTSFFLFVLGISFFVTTVLMLRRTIFSIRNQGQRRSNETYRILEEADVLSRSIGTMFSFGFTVACLFGSYAVWLEVGSR